MERAPGVHRVIISAPADPWSGKRRQITRTVHGTRRDAQRVLDELRSAIPTDPATSGTIAQLVEAWWPVHDLRPQTASRYRLALDRWVLPTIGRRRLRDLRPTDVEAWHRVLAERGATPDTVRTAHTVLSAALTHAGRLGWVTTNVARLAKSPTVQRIKRETPYAAELRALLDAASADGIVTEAWLRLAIVTGARRSEVLALRWTDIDIDARRLTIARSLVDDGGHIVEGPTKTRQVRTILLGPDTVATLVALAGHLEQRAAAAGVELAPDAFVIPGSIDGARPVNPSTMTALFRTLAERAGVPSSVRLHDLRHAMVSHVVAELGAPAAAKRAGHARTSMTLDVYADSIGGQDAAAAEVMESMLRLTTAQDGGVNHD